MLARAVASRDKTAEVYHMCDGVQQQQRAAAAASHISISNRLRSELYLYIVGTTTILRGDVTEAGIILGMSIIPEPCLL